MSYTIHHFETLRQRFPEWTVLKNYLESQEGGLLRIVQEEGARHAIIRYVKGKSAMGQSELGVGLFRSVVWDTESNRPVCFAPPKARDGRPPISLGGAGGQQFTTEDFIDGVMVNVFIDMAAAEGAATAAEPAVLHVATRTVMGGHTKFYSVKSFSQMFDDGLSSTPLKHRDGLLEAMKSMILTDGEGPTPKALFASFVLQHPEHRIVAKVLVPTVYCVHVGSVGENGDVHVLERATFWPQALARLQIPSYPVRKFNSDLEIDDLMRNTAVQRGWRWQGLVFKDGCGTRWRLRTPTYLMLRELRGSESTVVDRFLRLRADRKVKEYLTHYGEDRKEMWDLEMRLRGRSLDALFAYSDVHKAHSVAFKDLPAAYKPVVYLAHLKWRNELRERGYKLRLQNIAEIVNSLKVFEQKRLLEAGPYFSVTKLNGEEGEKGGVEDGVEDGVEVGVGIGPAEVAAGGSESE